MKTVFTSLLLGFAGTLWTAGVQAAPITEPGVYTLSGYRYEFDVISSNIYWPAGSIVEVPNPTGEVVDDPVLAQAIGDLIHPLREAIGKTGRVVIEMTEKIEYFENPAAPFPGLDEDMWLQVDCLSGVLCDLGRIPSRVDFVSSDYSISATGFHLYEYSEDWWADFDGVGGGTIRFNGDERGDGSEQVVIDGIRYASISDAGALFQLDNVSVTRLIPPPVPLPASGLLLIGALGGAAALARRRARRSMH